jgi:Zn-dependent protease
MIDARSGSFRFFRFRGVQVYVHFSWFVVAWYLIATRRGAYGSVGWMVVEYVALFAIVLAHEFGHILACRQTGGVANEILLWPLGGLAFGTPPPRALAELWTIAAGPLVNVVLIPVLFVASQVVAASGLGERVPDLGVLLAQLGRINAGLLVFNLLPIFPLDGAQILRALLWLRVGRARSLVITTSIGFAGIAVFLVLRWSARADELAWTVALAVFFALQCAAAFRDGRALQALESVPAHSEFTCRACGQPPPKGPLWACERCGQNYDAFWTRGVCPHCATPRAEIRCPHCGDAQPLEAWERPATSP